MAVLKTLHVVAFVCCMSVAAQAAIVTAEPDDFANGADISDSFSGLTLSSVGPYAGTGGSLDGRVYSRIAQEPVFAATGISVFGNNLIGTDSASTPRNQLWYQSSSLLSAYRLRADFDAPADYVAIDFITNDSSDSGVLEAYDSTGTLLASADALSSGAPDTVEISRPSYDIAYIIASGVAGETLCLDNLTANIIPEPATLLLLGLGTLGLFRRIRR